MCIESFRTAHPSDVDAIVELVNKAYRPKTPVSGWTHEFDLIAGDRTDNRQVEAMLSTPNSAVLLGLKNAETVACVHIQKDGDACHIGMLAVSPALQGLGIGKQMLGVAERNAVSLFGSKKFTMTVLSLRGELLAFYLRRGYQKTGAEFDYPLSAGAGLPKFAGMLCQVLEKQNEEA